LVCLWGVADYLGIDPLGWRADANDYYGMLIFTSSIGNVNTFTAVAAVYTGVFAALTLREKANAFFYIGFFIGILSLITGLSDNAVLAIVGLFAILPFYALQDRKRIGKYLFLVAIFALALAFAGFITSAWTLTKVASHSTRGALVLITENNPWIFLIPAAVFAFLGFLLERLQAKMTEYRAKPFLIAWGGLCLIGLIAIVCIFIDVNTAAKLPIPEAIRPYFLFNDEWGTKRGYAWRTSFEFFKEFNLFNKLFGSGPETFGIFMSRNYYYEMLDFMNAVFDSPHSEPLQYLFTTGILGFLSFYSMIISGIVTAIKKDSISAAFAFGCVAYLFASIINISTPISTPIVFLTLALAASVKEHEKQI